MKRVPKPWGEEIIFAVTDRYVGKILRVRRGEILSLQYHRHKDETLYLICASGNRSAHVGLVLEQHGYDTVNVVGGTSAWVRSGKAYDQGL